MNQKLPILSFKNFIDRDMQDVHGVYGPGADTGGGPIFRDRRMRSAVQQAIKCPRCDSSNTKFCYYNNYNLSQPRHFCKNCRRYWTNGGVLRNVPVGGGNRKPKRSFKRKASSPALPLTASKKSNSQSSSESTSAKAQSAGKVAEESVTGSVSEFSEKPPVMVTAAFDTVQAPIKPDCSVMNSNFESLNDPGGFANISEIGGFVSFMSGDQNQNLFEFGVSGDIKQTPFRIHQQNPVDDDQQLMRNPTAEDWPGMLDQTVHVRSGGRDWDGVYGGVGGGRGSLSNYLFDLTPGSSGGHGGDQWSQSDDQWHESDYDHHLYLPP